MAGFYPDVPSYKMACDKDGTQWVKYTAAGAGTALTSTEINQVCDWVSGGPAFESAAGGMLCAVFPEKRDLVAVNVKTSSVAGGLTLLVETSVDTTNGQDGTWVSTGVTFTDEDSDAEFPVQGPAGRTGIKAAAASGVRGVRVRKTAGASGSAGTTFHLFGNVSAGQAVHRLAFWHPTLDQEIGPAYLDWGDVRRASGAQVRSFRVKNLSASLTADDPRVALESLTDATPSLVAQHQVSADNSTWLSQVTLADLAPGAISPVTYVKLTPSASAEFGLWTVRVFCEPTGWI